MAGHSKWAQIKRSKAKIDSQRSASFTKLSREIYVAAKLGGGDPDGNFRLKTAIEKAKEGLMPADNIKRAIQRAVSGASTENYEEIQYEGYGPGGVAVIIEAMTDNRNRTGGDIRSYFIKCEGNLGETGCVGWMFSKKGSITITGHKNKEIVFDDLFMEVADLGAEDVIDLDNNEYQVYTEPDSSTIEKIKVEINKLGYTTSDVEILQIPSNTVEVTEELVAKRVLKLIDLLESHDDVQNVYANFELKDDLVNLL
ncbi:MAG: YebC/PmpR family DNA-binding transcriptional regulator [Candidatus Sericytochromatia bacterium]